MSRCESMCGPGGGADHPPRFCNCSASWAKSAASSARAALQPSRGGQRRARTTRSLAEKPACFWRNASRTSRLMRLRSTARAAVFRLTMTPMRDRDSAFPCTNTLKWRRTAAGPPQGRRVRLAPQQAFARRQRSGTRRVQHAQPCAPLARRARKDRRPTAWHRTRNPLCAYAPFRGLYVRFVFHRLQEKAYTTLRQRVNLPSGRSRSPRQRSPLWISAPEGGKIRG